LFEPTTPFAPILAEVSNGSSMIDPVALGALHRTLATTEEPSSLAPSNALFEKILRIKATVPKQHFREELLYAVLFSQEVISSDFDEVLFKSCEVRCATRKKLRNNVEAHKKQNEPKTQQHRELKTNKPKYEGSLPREKAIWYPTTSHSRLCSSGCLRFQNSLCSRAPKGTHESHKSSSCSERN